MSLSRVRRVAALEQAVKRVTNLPDEVLEAVYGRMDDYLGEDFDGSAQHVERLAVTVQGKRWGVLVTFFVDTDGTLNVLSIEGV